MLAAWSSFAVVAVVFFLRFATLSIKLMWRLRNIVIARASYNIIARKSVSLDPIVFFM